MKFEGFGSKGTRVIERKQSVTDGQTDRRTDKAKTICLPQKGGDIIKLMKGKAVEQVLNELPTDKRHKYTTRLTAMP